MPYLIDGHNLIPNIPGLSLQDLDDEIQLIEMLQEFCRRSRKQAEVYFDHAPIGQQSSRAYGLVRAYFVRQGQTADMAIKKRLERLGRQAHNWTVISSDLAVQGAARAAHTNFLSSDSFANILRETLASKPAEIAKKPDISLTEQEVDDWLDIFRQRKKGK